MDTNLLKVIGVLAIGAFFLIVAFILPLRRRPEERGENTLNEERCSIKWRLFGGLVAGGSIPLTRISFYNDFFVKALYNITLINYSEFKSASVKRNILSKSISLYLSDGRCLDIYPNNLDKVISVIETKVKLT